MIAILAQHPITDLEERLPEDLRNLVLTARALMYVFKNMDFSESAAQIITRNHVLFEAILIIAKSRNQEREISERLKHVAQKDLREYYIDFPYLFRNSLPRVMLNYLSNRFELSHEETNAALRGITKSIATHFKDPKKAVGASDFTQLGLYPMLGWL